MDPRTVMTDAKRALNVEVREIEVRAPDDVERVVRTAKEQGVQAPYTWTHNPYVWGTQHSALANAHRLPTLHLSRESALAGGLLSYAPSLTHVAGRGAEYVDTILRGTRPADLSVEQPTQFELVINLRTAKPLGLNIPPSLLAPADQVIDP